MILDDVNRAKGIVEDADAILITAGAGMGVDSGLPDFRGNEGFWKAYPPIKKLGISFSQMANPSWFEADPELAWAFYGHRLGLYRKTVPHDGFKLLLDLVHKKNDNYFIFTSNVDGQFQKAGFDEENIVECHGSIHHMQCSHNCCDEIFDAKDISIDVDMEKFKALNIPKCKNCGEVIRPNILMFGDWQWNSRRTSKQERNYEKWLSSLKQKDMSVAIIEIGAGLSVPTVRYEGESVAKELNGKLLRINPSDEEVDEDIGISLPYGGYKGLKKII